MHLKKFLSGLMLAVLVACGGDNLTTTNEPVNEAPAPAPVAAATPTPQPVNDPPTAPQHDAKVKGGFYSVTNTTGIPQFYCAAAFGVLPGGEQGAGTNLYEDQGIRQNKDTFSGQAPKTAACQYKQIQVDLTQEKDCRNFNWNNVLAAEVYDNPGFIESSKKVLVNESEAGNWSEYTPWSEYSPYSEYGPWSAWSQQDCGERTRTRTKTRTRTRSRDLFKVEKFECSGEIVKTKLRTETETQTDTYTDTQKETKDCYVPTCEDLNPPNFLVQSVEISWDTTGSDKNGINSMNVNVRFFNAGHWELILEARAHSNDNWTLKDYTDKTLECGRQNDKTVHEEQHDWNRWRFRIKRNGVTVFTSQEYVHP